MEREGKLDLKSRAIEELKAFWLIVLYLWVFLGSFTVYRRLIIAETGVSYLHYGIALIEALVIAKVILVGRMFSFSRQFEDRRLIFPVIYKSILFGLLVLLFGILEHVVEGWIHGQGLAGGFRSFADIGLHELGARVLMLIVAFVPFFAFGEIGRVLGGHRLADMFFAKPKPKGDEQRTNS